MIVICLNYNREDNQQLHNPTSTLLSKFYDDDDDDDDDDDCTEELSIKIGIHCSES